MDGEFYMCLAAAAWRRNGEMQPSRTTTPMSLNNPVAANLNLLLINDLSSAHEPGKSENGNENEVIGEMRIDQPLA
eukprot:scaffold2632_cov136-Skeletonema_dohrnii-CCMP3373.AAC.6